MKGYKAFEKGLICKGKQYAENTVFEEKNSEICKSGMHFCKSPFDTLNYYPIIGDDGNFTEFAEVESLEEPLYDGKDKFCTKKLKIGAKLDFPHFINAGIEFIIEKTSKETESGDSAKIGSSGKDCVICCAGHGSIVKAKKGSWITLSEWEYNEVKDRCVPKCVKTEYVDGEHIKEDTFYKLENGKFVELQSCVDGREE